MAVTSNCACVSKTKSNSCFTACNVIFSVNLRIRYTAATHLKTSFAFFGFADEVLVSWDSGECWRPIELTEAIFVDNIRLGQHLTSSALGPLCL